MYACLKMSLVATALISTSVVANAADVPRPPVRSPLGIIYDWTGFYAGGHVGGGWANVDVVRMGRVSDDTSSGLLLGVGAEYAFQNNWTAKVEYNRMNVDRD